MIRELFYKWFNLELPPACQTCEVLRAQLDESNRERKELLHALLDKGKPEPESESPKELQPIKPRFTPWHVRQQMLEVEDRKKAQLLREKQKEMDDSRISELEKELDIAVQKEG